ncbi:DUF2919 domain-containing protein [Enterobacteriaceae bacterium 4M9]|nr:DUF2919 domain-containing protein [Enterobacteriaceae bacterium 4M9]
MCYPSDYDDSGRLRLPWLFWLVLVLQARTWVLLVVAGASREQGEAILSLFYPDRQAFWQGLCAGLPAAAAFLLSGRRQHFPRLWRAWQYVLIVAQLVLLIWQLTLVLQNETSGIVALLLIVLDLFALGWLATSRYLRACFSTVQG